MLATVSSTASTLQPKFPINFELHKLNVVDPKLSSDIADQILLSLSNSKIIERTANAFGLRVNEKDITNVNVSCISGKGMNRVVLKVDANFKDENIFTFVLKFPRAENPTDINALNHAVMSIALGNVFSKDTGVLCATLEEKPRMFITGPYYPGYCADQVIKGNVREALPGQSIALVMQEYLETWYETANPHEDGAIKGGKNIEPTFAQFIITDGDANLIDKGHFARKNGITYNFTYNEDRTKVEYQIIDVPTSTIINEKETSKWIVCCGIAEAFLTFYSYMKQDIRRSMVTAALDDPDSAMLATYREIEFDKLAYRPLEGIKKGLFDFMKSKFNQETSVQMIDSILNDAGVQIAAQSDLNLDILLKSLKSESPYSH